MKQLAIATVGLMISHFSFGQTSADKQKVESLLKQMTLEEKVGQMTQVTLGVVATAEDGVLNPSALKKAVVDYRVGSILNVTNHALSVDQWNKVITQIQDETKNSRLKIPVLYGLDGIHGQTYTLESTLFPQNIGMAATRNPELAKAVTKVSAKELRASGVRWNFAPVLDLGRQPHALHRRGRLHKTVGLPAGCRSVERCPTSAARSRRGPPSRTPRSCEQPS